MYEIAVKSILVELFEIFEAWRGFECTNLNSGGSRKYVMKIIRENEKKKKKNRNSTLNAASGGGYLFSAMVNSSTCALGLLERTLWKTENAFDTIRDLEGMKERR